MADLIGLAVVFLILALVAYILGAQGIAGFSMEIAKWLVIIFISVEYPASLLRGWKTSPRTVNNNTIYQFRFRFVNFCSN